MSDDDIGEKHAQTMRIKKHLDAIKEELNEENLDQFKEFFHEKHSNNSSHNDFLADVEDAADKKMNIDPGRLLGLTDGIFGMVMTLLVFGIALPEMKFYTYNNFLATIMSLLHSIGVTIVSFILISSFWVYHHQYIKLKSLNIPYLWLNMLFLICISFIPFTTSLIGAYSRFFASEIIFGINILLTIISFILIYVYAYKKDLFEVRPSKSENHHIMFILGTIIILTTAVNILLLTVSCDFIYLLLLIPVVSTVLDIRYNYMASRKS